MDECVCLCMEKSIDGVRHAELIEEIEKLQPKKPRAYGQWTATLAQVCRLFSHIRGTNFTANSLGELAAKLASDIYSIKDEDLTTKVWGQSMLTLQEGSLLYETNSGRRIQMYEKDGLVQVTFDADAPSRFFYATCCYFLGLRNEEVA